MRAAPPGASGEAAPGRRRSELLQERSRRTRQRLIRAALDLWGERGFETGIDTTTVEEIARSAGVTKGTFYFHFPRKEQILLEMGWSTAAGVYDEAVRAIDSGRTMDEILDRLLGAIARRVRAAPRPAVARAVAEFQRISAADLAAAGRVGFRDAFRAVFARGQDGGEFPPDADPLEVAGLLQALVMDSILDWGVGAINDLPGALRRRAAILLAGVAADVRPLSA
jgi:AcrR family transcriptional regulator